MKRKTTRGQWEQHAEFMALAALEPRLLDLRDRAHTIRVRVSRDGEVRFCADDEWCNSLRRDVADLVGWNLEHPVLGTCEAFNVVHAYLRNRLPDCSKGCKCADALCLAPPGTPGIV